MAIFVLRLDGFNDDCFNIPPSMFQTCAYDDRCWARGPPATACFVKLPTNVIVLQRVVFSLALGPLYVAVHPLFGFF